MEKNDKDAEIQRLKEIISHLPKVPTMPYEKSLAIKLRIAMEALEEIANEDYRGNRSNGSVKAYQALQSIKGIE
jgi:hypothetical protein